MALVSAIANVLWLYYPFWALTIITLDIFVIWAIAAHGGELRDRVWTAASRWPASATTRGGSACVTGLTGAAPGWPCGA